MKFSHRRGLQSVAALGVAILTGGEAAANDPMISVGEVSAPAHASGASGFDAAGLRDAAEGEIRQLDTAGFPVRRRFVVSLAVMPTAGADGSAVSCTINALLRDARTGAMIAIIESASHADGPVSVELQRKVAHAAVRNAMRRIPNAVGVK